MSARLWYNGPTGHVWLPSCYKAKIHTGHTGFSRFSLRKECKNIALVFIVITFDMIIF